MRVFCFASSSGTACAVADGSQVLEREAAEQVIAPIAAALPPLASGADEAAAALRDGTLLAPLAPRKIIAVGLNYADHISEQGAETPKWPLLFAKLPSAVLAPGEQIVIDRAITTRVDWEVELAVVVGRRMRRVSRDDAMAHVFGYTAANDVTARDLQASDGQWTRAKGLDTFCPIGPVLVTADEIADPGHVHLKTTVNGEVMQDSDTSLMVFGVAEILAFASAAFTLEPGDLILTGTPRGCGEFMHPRRSLQDGDVVHVSVEGVGTLVNRVSG